MSIPLYSITLTTQHKKYDTIGVYYASLSAPEKAVRLPQGLPIELFIEIVPFLYLILHWSCFGHLFFDLSLKVQHFLNLECKE